MSGDIDFTEQELREALSRLRREYEDLSRPLVDALAKIDLLKPRPPMFITEEQAKSLGLDEIWGVK